MKDLRLRDQRMRHEDGRHDGRAAAPGKATLVSATSGTPSTAVVLPGARQACHAAADVATNAQLRMIGQVEPRYRPSIEMLYQAITGSRGGKTLEARERTSLLDRGLAGLRPAIAAVQADDPAWVRDHLDAPLEHQRDRIQYARAGERVDAASLLEDGRVVELDDTALDAHQRGALLRTQIKPLAQVLVRLDEQVLRYEHTLAHHLGKLEQVRQKTGITAPFDTLAAVQGVLWLIDGFLSLTDEEFAHHLAEVDGVFGGIRTYGELVAKSLEVIGGLVSVSASFAYALATRLGETGMARRALGLMNATTHKLGSVIAGVEVVVGMATILDPHSSTDERIEGGFTVVINGAWLLEGVKVAGTKLPGAAVSTYATAAWVAYHEVRTAIRLNHETKNALTAMWMQAAMDTLHMHAVTITDRAGALLRCAALLERETDPGQIEALTKLQVNLATMLGGSIDALLEDCQPRAPIGAGIARYPGCYPKMVAAFAPLQSLAGLSSPEDVAPAAATALEKITWCFLHAGEII